MLELKQAVRSSPLGPVLAGVDLQISRERPTSLLGLEAGLREALGRLLAGAERLTSGSILLDGKDVAQVRRAKAGIARVGAHGAPKSSQKVGKQIDSAAAARVRLDARLEAVVSTLDLEQRVRLSIARALAERPALLLLDAPASGLDGEPRARFAADLRHMVEGCGAVVVLMAGAADEALGLGGEAVVLANGHVQQSGPVGEVAAQPANLACAAALAWPTLNKLEMTITAGRGRLTDGSSLQPPEGLTLPDAGACVLAFRPDDSTLARETPGCMRFVARAAGEESVAGRTYERVAFAGASWLSPLVTAPPPRGAVLNVFVDRGKVLVFDRHGRAVR